MSPLNAVLAALITVLFIFNVYQYLTQRSALRIAEILYLMSRNVREKASEVRRDGKDVEIVEAHLFDISTSARSLLRVLGRSESSLGPDPAVDLARTANRLDSDSLLRLADNILYAVSEESPNDEWNAVVDRALDRFMAKVPSMERDAARKIVAAVARKAERETNGSLPFALKQQP